MIGSGPLLPRLRNKWRRRPSDPSEVGSSCAQARDDDRPPPIATARVIPDGKGPGPTARGRRDSFPSECEHLSLEEYEGVRVRVDGLRIVKVYVPDGKGPGHEVTVRGCGGPDDGRKFRAVVPPRRHWNFECRDGGGGEHRSPRPFFLIRPVDRTVPAFFLVRRSSADDAPAAASRATGPRRRASVLPKERSPVTANAVARRVSFQDQETPRMVCRCVLSEGVFDPRCPVHGIDAHHRAMCPSERDDGSDEAGPPVGDEELPPPRRASLATPLLDDERCRRREIDERHDAELARALGESELLAAEEERRLRSEEELVWNSVGKTRAAGEEEVRRNEEDLLVMALANSLADVSFFDRTLHERTC